MVRWLAEFIDVNTEKWVGGQEAENKMDIEKWEKLETAERLKLVKERRKGNSINVPKHLTNPPKDELGEVGPKSRSTKRIELGITLEASRAEHQSNTAIERKKLQTRKISS